MSTPPADLPPAADRPRTGAYRALALLIVIKAPFADLPPFVFIPEV